MQCSAVQLAVRRRSVPSWLHAKLFLSTSRTASVALGASAPSGIATASCQCLFHRSLHQIRTAKVKQKLTLPTLSLQTLHTSLLDTFQLYKGANLNDLSDQSFSINSTTPTFLHTLDPYTPSLESLLSHTYTRSKCSSPLSLFRLLPLPPPSLLPPPLRSATVETVRLPTSTRTATPDRAETGTLTRPPSLPLTAPRCTTACAARWSPSRVTETPFRPSLPTPAQLATGVTSTCPSAPSSSFRALTPVLSPSPGGRLKRAFPPHQEGVRSITTSSR